MNAPLRGVQIGHWAFARSGASCSSRHPPFSIPCWRREFPRSESDAGEQWSEGCEARCQTFRHWRKVEGKEHDEAADGEQRAEDAQGCEPGWRGVIEREGVLHRKDGGVDFRIKSSTG
jgi:hypothetical protein